MVTTNFWPISYFRIHYNFGNCLDSSIFEFGQMFHGLRYRTTMETHSDLTIHAFYLSDEVTGVLCGKNDKLYEIVQRYWCWATIEAHSYWKIDGFYQINEIKGPGARAHDNGGKWITLWDDSTASETISTENVFSTALSYVPKVPLISKFKAKVKHHKTIQY